jgi:hypothetical protein
MQIPPCFSIQAIQSPMGFLLLRLLGIKTTTVSHDQLTFREQITACTIGFLARLSRAETQDRKVN